MTHLPNFVPNNPLFEAQILTKSLVTDLMFRYNKSISFHTTTTVSRLAWAHMSFGRALSYSKCPYMSMGLQPGDVSSQMPFSIGLLYMASVCGKLEPGFYVIRFDVRLCVKNLRIFGT